MLNLKKIEKAYNLLTQQYMHKQKAKNILDDKWNYMVKC